MIKLTFTTTAGRTVSATFENREQALSSMSLFLVEDESIENYELQEVEHQPVPSYVLPPSSN